VPFSAITGLFWPVLSASTLLDAHPKAHAVPIGRGFAERDPVHGEKSTRRITLAGDQFEKRRCAFALIVQSSDVRSTESDRCDDSSPSPRPVVIQKTTRREPLEAFSMGSIVLLWNPVPWKGCEATRIHLLNEIDDFV